MVLVKSLQVHPKDSVWAPCSMDTWQWQGYQWSGGEYLSGDAAMVPGVAAQILTAKQQFLFQFLLQLLGGPLHDEPLLGEL